MGNKIFISNPNNKNMLNYSWYQTLNQPAFSPPGWIFAPVWTFLYLTMFVSLIYYAKSEKFYNKAWGYVLFFSQILVNFAWSPIFFGLKNIGLALAVVILLDFLVLWNIIVFYKNSKPAGLILIPYFLWILFATYLNFGYFVLN